MSRPPARLPVMDALASPSGAGDADGAGDHSGAASPSPPSPLLHATAAPPAISPLALIPPVASDTQPPKAALKTATGGPPLVVGGRKAIAPPAASGPTAKQKELLETVLVADVEKLLTDFNQTDWNFEANVVGRGMKQSPFGLLLRPELNYGNLSRLKRADQTRIIKHLLGLPDGYTPRLDGFDTKDSTSMIFGQHSMSFAVCQAVYQGRVDLLDILYATALDRERLGTGVRFNVRDTFFSSKLTLLHMAAHDGRVDMARWIVQKWADAAKTDPDPVLNAKYVPDCLDLIGQTPLFWCFARGIISVEVAQFLIDECHCDFFKVFKLKPNSGQEPVYASAFSLAIQVAPSFAEHQLAGRTEHMGTRLQQQVMRYDFAGVALTPEQIVATQQQVDAINQANKLDSTNKGLKLDAMEGSDFRREASNQLKIWARKERHGENPPPAVSSGEIELTKEAKAEAEQAAREAKAAAAIVATAVQLRFVSVNGQLGLKPKDRWDTFHYEFVPRSAVELMVKYDRKKLLLTPLMVEVQQRLWDQLATRFYLMMASFVLFGILFSINTGIWPRTAELYGTNIARPLTPTSDRNMWIALYFVCNLVCIALASLLFCFHGRACVQGLPTRWRNALSAAKIEHAAAEAASIAAYEKDRIAKQLAIEKWEKDEKERADDPALEVKWRKEMADAKLKLEQWEKSKEKVEANKPVVPTKPVLPTKRQPLSPPRSPVVWFSCFFDGIRATVRSGSVQLDLAILSVFIIVESMQWTFVCHTPQFASLGTVMCHGTLGALNQERLSILGWFGASLHLLLGLKILELVSVFEFAGPLLSTLIGMCRDVGRFMAIFAVGYGAFTCAVWIVLKDIYNDVGPGLNGPGSVMLTDPPPDTEPIGTYSYSGSMASVLLWVFVSFDFDVFTQSTLVGTGSLGRVLLLAFLVVMVLVMLNLMIAMFSTTYANVVEDGAGAWHQRFSGVLCELLRMAGDEAEIARNFVIEMAVENNCGVDRPMASTDDAYAEEGEKAEAAKKAAAVDAHLERLHATVEKLRKEQRDMRKRAEKTVKTIAEENLTAAATA